MIVSYSKKFIKQYFKLPLKTQERFDARVKLLLDDSRDVQLNLHKLSGSFEESWSMNITGDIRAVFDKRWNNSIHFVAIGSHSQLYGK